jgi:hypothetical protein
MEEGSGFRGVKSQERFFRTRFPLPKALIFPGTLFFAHVLPPL